MAYQQWPYHYYGRPPEQHGGRTPEPPLHPMYAPPPPPAHMPMKDWSHWGQSASASRSVYERPYGYPPHPPYDGGWASEAASAASYSQSAKPVEEVDNEEDENFEENPNRPRPINPGSSGHPDHCKPCNKYNRDRPDSCKHGDKCDFCHESHERPKHRGQRGRHALQRRQYLESREDMPKFVRDLVDQIYTIPHKAIDEVKAYLTNQHHVERDRKCAMVLARIREIGINAQNNRPDNARLRGAVIETGMEGQASISEIDGRCKWLIGTLHLMVRKMHDAKEPQQKIEESVCTVLAECQNLRQEVESGELESRMQVPSSQVRGEAGAARTAQHAAAPSGEKGSQALRIPKTFEVLQDKVQALVRGENADGSEIGALSQLFEQAEQNSERMNDEERFSMVQLLQQCGSLSELKECLQENEVLQRFKDRFLSELDDMEGFDDLQRMQDERPEGPLVSCLVTWEGGQFPMPYREGAEASVMREAIAKYLTEQAYNPPIVGAPTIRPAQVHLGVLGLPVELDYNESIPQLVQNDLRAVIVRKGWQEEFRVSIGLTLPVLELSKDESWCNSTDFALLTAMINAVDTRQSRSEEGSTALKDALTAKSPPLSIFEIIRKEIGAADFKRLHYLVGETEAHLRIELGDRFKFLEDKINTLTQHELKTAKPINHIRAALDRIEFEVKKLQVEIDKPELQECLTSSTDLGVLSERIREAFHKTLKIYP